MERRAFIAAAAFAPVSGLRDGRTESRFELLHSAWQRGCIYTREVVVAMPQGDWEYRPALTVRTFKDAVVHLATATVGFAGLITGGDSTERIAGSPSGPQETLALLDQAAEVGTSALQVLPTRGDRRVAWQRRLGDERDVPLWAVAETMRDHMTHHRAQLVVYLRLRGIEPPAYVD